MLEKVEHLSEKVGSETLDHVIQDCLAMRIRMLNRALTQLYDTAFRQLKLKVGQFTILAVAEREGAVVPSELSVSLCIDPSTLSRNLSRLAERGWIESLVVDDARSQPFRLTAEGRRVFAQALPLWEQAQAAAAKLLGEMGVALLREAARKLK